MANDRERIASLETTVRELHSIVRSLERRRQEAVPRRIRLARQDGAMADADVFQDIVFLTGQKEDRSAASKHVTQMLCDPELLVFEDDGVLFTPTDPSYEATLDEEINENESGLATLCRGPVEAIECGASEPIDISNSTGTTWVWSTGEDAIWSDSTAAPGDQITVWNFDGRRGNLGERVHVHRTALRGGYPCFWSIRFVSSIGGGGDWIIGTANSDIDFDTDGSITVVAADTELLVGSSVGVSYRFINSGTISSGTMIFAKYYASVLAEDATPGTYVIHNAACEFEYQLP